MKKLTAMLLTVLMLAALIVPACAEGIDLSALSWEELIALKAQIDKEMLSRDEWQEVTVPQGVWHVGEDIPAGKWTIRCKEGYLTTINWGSKLNESKQEIAFGGIHEFEVVYNPDYRNFRQGDRTEYTIEVEDGMWIVVEEGDCVFTPFTGKPALGFK